MLGFETLGEYRFNTKLKIHKFCKNCGTSILIDFNGMDPDGDTLAVNVLLPFSSFSSIYFKLRDRSSLLFVSRELGDSWLCIEADG